MTTSAGERITVRLRQQIVRGRWAPGAQLPARDALAQELNACQATLQVAVKRLIGRVRPSEFGPYAYMPFSLRPEYASLPSGHSTAAFATMVAESIVARRRLIRDNWQEHVSLHAPAEAQALLRRPGQGLIVASALVRRLEQAGTRPLTEITREIGALAASLTGAPNP